MILFYPFAFSGICTGELCALRDDLAAFQNDDVQVLAISCDSPFTQRVFAEHAVDAVIHFAALKSVGESVREPLRYFENNVAGSDDGT